MRSAPRRVDIWTGTSDHTLRRLEINFGLPVNGTFSALLGGLRSARLSLLVQYADVNQPQTITAPSTAAPFSDFVTKLRAFIGGLQGTLSGGSPSGGSSSTNTQTLQRYTQCIQSAHGDVSKMQRCASILNGG